MERIAPLAKILAEANGIEWEQLAGTGSGGQIVEQDILDYLTRVMSGEAEPPSTPVDAPPPDWDGQDIPGGGMFDASALSRAGVESDIAEFVSQGRPAGPQVPGTGTPALSTDDFELDDAPNAELISAPTAPPHFTASQSVPAPVAAPMPSQMLSPSAPVSATAPEPVMPAAPTEVAPSFAAAAAPVVAGAAAGGLGSLLSRLYHKEEPAAPSPAEPVAAPSTYAAEAAPIPAAPAAAEMPAAMPEVTPAAPAFEVPRTDDRIAVPVAPLAHAEAAPVPAPVEVPAVSESEQAQPAVVSPAPTHTAPVTPVSAGPADFVPAAPAAPAQATQPNAAHLPQGATWFGTYLRRSADVAYLSDLRAQLSDALERDVPLSFLVARAAQRHADQLGLSSVALQDVTSHQARSLGQGNLRGAIEASDTPFEGTPDLLVVDAASLDLDDLHYPHTVTLSLGRVEDGRASLSLQGNVDQARAAQFLASVAQTLAKPIILLV